MVADGAISFGALGTIAFDSVENLSTLNAIVKPPRVVKALERLMADIHDRDIILDAALLPLWHVEPLFDACLWVEARPDVRLERLLRSRPDLSEAALAKRMRLQQAVLEEPGSSGKWTKIDNSNSVEALEAALLRFT